ncbi:uncharacterized protein LOC132734934 [Ruditapes philippinarum]|uniref:uncharacterized protein LOC132734934 n=1 Tax=Ruditapes philippinarum TaxID=129788 RepID=UPI00295AE90E|nr:uncharacterized protein LOC132734934 [Ruditapes philippinarum]
MIWQKLTITTRLTLCALIHFTSGGNISIQKPGNQTGETPYECGRNVTLTCKFKKNTFAIVWMKATDIIPIAKCTQNNCVLTPEYNGQYTFTYDIQGILNLTIIEITKEDNGRKLICSDGSDSDYEVIKVTDYEPLLFEDTISGTVRAISGCISQDTEVSFKWIKMSVSSGIEEEIIPTIHDNYTRSTRGCSNDSACGFDQQVQYTEMISAKSSDDGKYYLKVLAVYGNENKESYHTAYKYIIREHGTYRYLQVCKNAYVEDTNLLLKDQCDSPMNKPEEQRKTTTHSKNDKPRQNEEDMERSKKLFDRRHPRRHCNPKDGNK